MILYSMTTAHQRHPQLSVAVVSMLLCQQGIVPALPVEALEISNLLMTSCMIAPTYHRLGVPLESSWRVTFIHSFLLPHIIISVLSLFNSCNVDCKGLRPLVPVKGTLNASADQEILDNSMFPTLWEQFEAGPLPLPT